MRMAVLYEYKLYFKINCFQYFHFLNRGWPSPMLYDCMINECNTGIRKLANDIYCSCMIYLSFHWKRQHFASAFNCFVGVRINIYKLAMVRNFTVTMSGYWNWNCSCLSVRYGFHFISFVLLCDFHSGFAQFITEMPIQLFTQTIQLCTLHRYMYLPLESI